MTDHVLDASAAVELVLATPRGRSVGQLVGAGAPVHSADVVVPEALHALRGLERVGRLRDAGSRVDAFFSIPIVHWRPTERLARRGWEWRPNITAYDAAYVALAEWLGATLVTADDRLADAVRRHTSVTVADLERV